MVRTFTLVNADAGRAKDVLGKLTKIGKNIDAEVYALFGEWDFLVIAVSPNLKSASNKVIADIQGIDGVSRTRTLVEAEI